MPLQISKDQFDDWLENPVTEVVLKAAYEQSKSHKAEWAEKSWVQGADPIMLAEMKARSATAFEFSEMTFEWLEMITE